MSVSVPAVSAQAQVNYESRVRVRYGIVATCAAVLLVASQVIQLTGPHAHVSELTVDLMFASKRATADVVGAALDMLGLLSVGVLLNWLHLISHARNPSMKQFVRWLAVVGAVLTAAMAIIYTVVVATKAQEFMSTGNQGYPEANALTSGGLVEILPLLLQLGTLLLTVGCIWTSLNAMRVGLLTRIVGYVGVLAGVLFLFPLGAIVPVVQGYWLLAVAVILIARWPSGDPPAWAAGEAVAWAPSAAAAARQQRARAQRAPRRRVSTKQVMAAVDTSDRKPARTGAPSPSTSAGKRKRKRR